MKCLLLIPLVVSFDIFTLLAAVKVGYLYYD